MGCAGSKIVSPHSDGSKPIITDDAPPSRRQARLSLAGGYNQYEPTKFAQPAVKTLTGTIVHPLESTDTGSIDFRIKYAAVSQRGYYPDQPEKANQDAVLAVEEVANQPMCQLFGVCDGHGEQGTECAEFAAERIPINMTEIAGLMFTAPEQALHLSIVATNVQLHSSPIDDLLSGSTACIALLVKDQLYIANVGDSRAVLAELDADGQLTARDLSQDQTPFRLDEAERVKSAGARVLTLDQVEGLKDIDEQCWTNEENCDGDPPRLWAKDGIYPGTAFTRSIGDKAAETIGVFAEPEISNVQVSRTTPFAIIASDGVFEFISSQKAVDIVSQFKDPREAAQALVATSYKAWLQKETRTDDISVVVLQFEFPEAGEEDSVEEGSSSAATA